MAIENPCKVYVGNLDESVDEEKIREEAEKFGRIDNIWMAKNPPGFCFVYFVEESDAEDCVKAFDNSTLFGRQIRAEIARTRRREDPRSSKGIGGFRIRIENISSSCDWRDLKDFFRDGLRTQVTYANVDGNSAIVEFNSETDRERAIDKYDNTDFKGNRISIQKTEGSTAEYFKSRGINSRPGGPPPPRRNYYEDDAPPSRRSPPPSSYARDHMSSSRSSRRYQDDDHYRARPSPDRSRSPPSRRSRDYDRRRDRDYPDRRSDSYRDRDYDRPRLDYDRGYDRPPPRDSDYYDRRR